MGLDSFEMVLRAAPSKQDGVHCEQHRDSKRVCISKHHKTTKQEKGLAAHRLLRAQDQHYG